MTAAAVVVREALEGDVPGIQRVFEAVYGHDYPYQGFFDDWWLKRSVFGDDILLLVAVDADTSNVVGTASVVFDVGAHSDLSAEFGRLAVLPDQHGRGIGRRLMTARIEHVQDRIHVGVVENRTAHERSQRISAAHGFVPVGFLPMKIRFRKEESVVLYCRHFGCGLDLRRNHPRVLPEAASVAALALHNVGLENDVTVDDTSHAYPRDAELAVEALDARGLPSLIRIERGRVRHREVFGPMRLHYGFFQLTARRATYLVARETRSHGGPGPVAGAIGYIRDEFEATVKVFELIARDDAASRFLLERLVEHCGDDWGVRYLEVDVNAHEPGLQRTLLELGFLPAAYAPAFVFDEVERLDVVRMVRLFVPPVGKRTHLLPEAAEMERVVLEPFLRRDVHPRVAAACGTVEPFETLDEEQTRRLAAEFEVRELEDGAVLFRAGEVADRIFLVLEGQAEVRDPSGEVLGRVEAGEALGERALLTRAPHAAGAVARGRLVVGALGAERLERLVRSRPDIGVALYRQLAVGLGRKLARVGGQPRGD